ncbi:MAG: sugar isomerase, partial [Actinobacteria bacterium]|nr:sugar isomerase [Actinomycetota bacterium]
EAAQAWAEAYPLLDYRHGPLAVAGETSLVWIIGRSEPSLVEDIERVGATVRTSRHDPLVELANAQRLAVELAAHRGLDPDNPRHLTRSIVLG